MARSTLGQAANSAGINIPTTTETVIASIPAQAGGGLVPQPAFPISIEGSFSLTPGTGATSVTVRVRLTNVTGAVVYTSPAIVVTAGAPIRIPIDAVDAGNNALNAGGAIYVITVQQGAATANGNVNDVVARVELP